MRKSRFQRTNSVRLALTEGDWIEVRERLSGFETRKMAGAAFTSMNANGDIAVDFPALGLARTKKYLTDWNFVDDNDKRIPLSESAIAALDEEALKEIEAALDVHCSAMEAESKANSGDPASSPDLSSAGSSGGRGPSTKPRRMK